MHGKIFNASEKLEQPMLARLIGNVDGDIIFLRFDKARPFQMLGMVITRGKVNGLG